MIAGKLGDAVTTQHADFSYTYFYTRGGRRIGLRAGFAHMPRSSIKVHRGADADTKEDIMVELKSEYGLLKRTYPSTTGFAAVADDVATAFQAGEKDPDFQPLSLVQDQPGIAETAAAWHSLAQRYGVPWPAPLSEKAMMLTAACTQIIDRYLHGPWVTSKRFKPAPLIDSIKAFWSRQKNAQLFAPMAQILMRLAKDRKIPVNDLSSIAVAAKH